jgi:integrase
MPRITFHGLRHSHVTHLIKSGVPVKVISARVGHANTNITNDIYGHLIDGMQEEAAEQIDVALRGARKKA